MKTESHEPKHISAFTIYVQDPDTGNSWGAWNKYTEGQYSIGVSSHSDADIVAEKNRLESLGYKLLGTRIRCCLNATHFEDGIIKAISKSDSNSYTQAYVY